MTFREPRHGIGTRVAVALAAALVLLALRRDIAYDFARYTAVTGIEASRWTWLGAAAGLLGAIVALVVRRDAMRYVAWLNLVAGLIIATTLAIAVTRTPHRAGEDTPSEQDCASLNNPIGCWIDKALPRSRPLRGNDAPSRLLLELALAGYVLVAAAATRSRT